MTKNYDFKTEMLRTCSQMFSLISDFGGQLGLWLGLSMMTVFESVELVVDLLVLAARRARRRNNNRVETLKHSE